MKCCLSLNVRSRLCRVVAGRAPLDTNEVRYVEEIVSARADDIVAKWIDFFVFFNPVAT